MGGSPGLIPDVFVWLEKPSSPPGWCCPEVSALYPSSGSQPHLLAGVLLWPFPPALPDMGHSGLGSSTNESNLLQNTLSEQTYLICFGSSLVSAVPRVCQNTLTWGFRERPNKSKFLIHRFYCRGQVRLWIQPLCSSCNLGSLVVQHTYIKELPGKWIVLISWTNTYVIFSMRQAFCQAMVNLKSASVLSLEELQSG